MPTAAPVPSPGQAFTDEEGRPLARVCVQVSELFGLPQYSNVTIGPILIERWVKDTPSERRAGLEECAAEVEEQLAIQRDAVVSLVKSATPA